MSTFKSTNRKKNFANPFGSLPDASAHRQNIDKLALCKGKIYGIVLYEIAILLTHFMKEYFNSFDDIQFFHTFSSISRDMKIVTLSEIHRYIQNFMLYKMIYFLSHKFAFSNLRFSSFYEHFRKLREKYAFKLKIKYIILISSLSPI